MRRNAAASWSTAAASHHRREHLQLGVAEVAHEPEVEERDPPVAVEQVVARVRIAVERAHPVQAAEHEAEQRLAGEVALGAGPSPSSSCHGAPTTSSLVSTAPVERCGQHVGHVDERVAAVERRRSAVWLAASLAVVELLGDPLA